MRYDTGFDFAAARAAKGIVKGMDVMVNGFPFVVTRVCDGPLAGMVEVERFCGGDRDGLCVDILEVTPVAMA